MDTNTNKETGTLRMAIGDICKNPLGRVLAAALIPAVISGVMGAVGGFFGVQMEVPDRVLSHGVQSLINGSL